MPFYWYRCGKCETEFSVFHRIKEVQTACVACEQEDTLTKLVTKPLKKKSNFKEAEVGSITKQYIKANKEILEKEKKKAKEETHEPS